MATNIRAAPHYYVRGYLHVNDRAVDPDVLAEMVTVLEQVADGDVPPEFLRMCAIKALAKAGVR